MEPSTNNLPGFAQMDAFNSVREGAPLILTKEIVDNICCFVSRGPFIQAQVVNCDGYHSFSLESITGIFGKIQANNQCEKPGPCPLCCGRVTTYHPNPALQSLVDSILGVHKGQAYVDQMYALIRKQKLEFDNGVKYPLEKTSFVLREAIFKEGYISINLVNKYRDQNRVNTIEVLSFQIENFDKNPCFTLLICFSDNDLNAKFKLLDYLKKNQVNSLEIDLYGGQYLHDFKNPNHQDFITCLRLLTTNGNEFDDRSQVALKKLMTCLETLIK